jgi:hypothetical protein
LPETLELVIALNQGRREGTSHRDAALTDHTERPKWVCHAFDDLRIAGLDLEAILHQFAYLIR